MEKCAHCSGKFQLIGGDGKRRYCSDACKVAAHRAREAPDARERRLAADRERKRDKRAIAARLRDLDL